MNPSATENVRVEDLLVHLNLSPILPQVVQKYEEDWRDRHSPDAMVRALIYLKLLKGKHRIKHPDGTKKLGLIHIKGVLKLRKDEWIKDNGTEEEIKRKYHSFWKGAAYKVDAPLEEMMVFLISRGEKLIGEGKFTPKSPLKLNSIFGKLKFCPILVKTMVNKETKRK